MLRRILFAVAILVISGCRQLDVYQDEMTINDLAGGQKISAYLSQFKYAFGTLPSGAVGFYTDDPRDLDFVVFSGSDFSGLEIYRISTDTVLIASGARYVDTKLDSARGIKFIYGPKP
jgi:hypothetical protein